MVYGLVVDLYIGKCRCIMIMFVVGLMVFFDLECCSVVFRRVFVFWFVMLMMGIGRYKYDILGSRFVYDGVLVCRILYVRV